MARKIHEAESPLNLLVIRAGAMDAGHHVLLRRAELEFLALLNGSYQYRSCRLTFS